MSPLGFLGTSYSLCLGPMGQARPWCSTWFVCILSILYDLCWTLINLKEAMSFPTQGMSRSRASLLSTLLTVHVLCSGSAYSSPLSTPNWLSKSTCWSTGASSNLHVVLSWTPILSCSWLRPHWTCLQTSWQVSCLVATIAIALIGKSWSLIHIQCALVDTSPFKQSLCHAYIWVLHWNQCQDEERYVGNVEEHCGRESSITTYVCVTHWSAVSSTILLTYPPYDTLWKKHPCLRTRSASYPRRCPVSARSLVLLSLCVISILLLLRVVSSPMVSSSFLCIVELIFSSVCSLMIGYIAYFFLIL